MLCIHNWEQVTLPPTYDDNYNKPLKQTVKRQNKLGFKRLNMSIQTVL